MQYLHMTSVQNHAIDITSLVSDGEHFARRNPHTQLQEIVSAVTGRVVAILEKSTNLASRIPVLERRLLPNGSTIFVETTISAVGNVDSIPYHPWIIDQICEKIANGGALTKICKEPGMPSYTTLCSWRRKYPYVEESLDKARLDRTEYMRDEAVAIALENEDHKFPTQAAKLKVDTLLQAAGFDNPKYSPKAKLDVSVTAPTQIIIQTGIDRTPLKEAVPTTEPLVACAEDIVEPLETPPPQDAITHKEPMNDFKDVDNIDGVHAATITGPDPQEPEAF